MDCPKCDWRIWSRSGNKDGLREGLAKHMADVHDVSATCPTFNKVFNSSKGKRAKQNSMEQHQQVRIFFVERFHLKYLEIIEFRCTGPKSIPALFVECRNSGPI